MHFNLFHGATKFQVMDEAAIMVHLSTTLARNKMAKAGSRYTPFGAFRDRGEFVVPRFSIIELLGFTMPYRISDDIYSFKIRFDCKETTPKLGVFYLYTNIKSLEVLDLEPIQ